MEATMRRRWITTIAAVMVAGLLLAACASDEGGDGSAGDGAEGTIEVTDAWARFPMDDRGAVYFVVVNDGEDADRLVGASSDLTGTVEVHETTMSEGVAEMAPVEAVDVAADGETVFEPGGYHVMLLDLDEVPEVGRSISLTLEFESAGQITVDAEVREFVEGEDGMMGEGGDEEM
jgi:hypothetical protein